MTPEDRQKGLLLLLRTRGRMRAEDLAAHLGVSERTIYRDVHALADFGFPIVALSAIGYELPPTAVVPPFALTLDASAETSVIGTLATTKESPLYRKLLQTDFIKASPSDDIQDWAPKPDGRGRSLASPSECAYMRVRRIIERRGACSLDANGDVFAPAVIVGVRGDWIVVGWSASSQSWLSRALLDVAAAGDTAAAGERPAAPPVDAWLPPLPPVQLRVRVWFPPITAALERGHRMRLIAEYESDGGHTLLYDLDPAGLQGMISRLLRYGDWFRVVEPSVARVTVARTASQIAQRHTR